VYFRQVRDKSLKRGYFQKVNFIYTKGKYFYIVARKIETVRMNSF